MKRWQDKFATITGIELFNEGIIIKKIFLLINISLTYLGSFMNRGLHWK